MSDSKNKPSGELKDHSKPLLASPKQSDQDSNVDIPDAKNANNDDAVSGFTQADYRNPQKVFKNENQSKLDSFLIYFSDTAGQKKNERKEEGDVKATGGNQSDEMSDGTVQSIPSPDKGKDQAKVSATINAPIDAKGCVRIDSLKQYIKNEASLIQNPRKSYFQLSKQFYQNKYPEGYKKNTIEVASQVVTMDNKNYSRNMTVDIIITPRGNVPFVKTFEHDYHNPNNFIKSIKFYDFQNSNKLLTQVKVDEGVMDQTYCTYDISTLHYEQFVIFYVRYDKWLQLQKYDIISNKQEEIPGYQIEVPNPEENSFNPMFAQEFGDHQNKIGGEMNIKQFLDSQFVFIQEYRHDGRKNEIQSMRMYSMSDTNTPITQSPQQMGVLQEAIQKVVVQKQYNDYGWYYTFTAFDAFYSHIFTCPENLEYHTVPQAYVCNNEFQMQNKKELQNQRYQSYDRHNNFNPFYYHENTQFLIQKDRVKLKFIEKGLESDQYFYITNDNQFMLVYPNYTDLKQKADVLEQLAKNHSYIVQRNFDYETDFKQRQKDYASGTYKKVSHLSHDNYRSRNYVKNSEHIRNIVGCSKFSVNHKIILSTDQENSDIFIYQSKEVTGKNLIENYSYNNNVDKASSLNPKINKSMVEGDDSAIKLPKQIQEVQIEEKKYGKRMTSKKAEEDASCFYMNANFKNVLSSKNCIQTQSKSQVDQKQVKHALPATDSKYFCLVEGTNSHQSQYYNIRIKHQHMNEDIVLQMYYRSKKYYVFVFSLVNEQTKFNRKQNFFLIRKTFQQVDELSQDNHKALISHDQEVYMVVDNDLIGTDEQVNTKYLQTIQFNKLIEMQASPNIQEYHVHLTFEALYDMQKRLEYLPFIYQEKRSLASHHLLVLDINAMKIVGKICINSNLKIRQYLRKSEAGYAMYSLTRTSEVFEQKLSFMQRMQASEDVCSQVIKYQVSHQYYIEDTEEHSNPAKSTLEFTEYLINFNNQTATSTNLKLVGRKQLLLSQDAQFKREQSFDKVFILPFFDRSGKVKGSQLILIEDDKVIKIADQDQNKIYYCETEMLQFGQIKFLTNESQHGEYILLVSAQLKQKVYMKGNLETGESHYILSKIQKKVLSMQLAKFEYYVLQDNFDQLMKDEFYQAQEVLQGKTICDICLNYPKDIAKALKYDDQNLTRIDGSLIDELCLGNQDKIRFFKDIGLCEDNLLIQPDFNFVTTLRLALELGANQTIKLILNKVFKMGKKEYQEPLMLDLPKLLEKDLIERMFPFMERDHEQYLQILDDQENLHTGLKRESHSYLHMEEFVMNNELPPFSAEKTMYHVKYDFIDYHDTLAEIMCEVIMKDPYMTWDIHNFEDRVYDMRKKKFEVEHSYVDFQKLIIGEKVRGYQEEFKNVEFNDQHLAQLLHKEDESQLQFYRLETVQKLIDYQWAKTQKFLSLMFRLYIFGFLGPFILSITVDNLLLQNFCYVFCFLTQCFFMLFELVQMRQYGLSYFQDFWNCIDLTQFGCFIYLFLNKLITQFQSDSFMEILFSAIILFLSIYKVMYFVRIYDSCNEIVILIQAATFELVPFGILSLALLFALSKIYQVLHMGVNDPLNLYSQISSDVMKQFMQTAKLSTGDKTPPTLDTSFDERLEGQIAIKQIFMFFLEAVWALQQSLSIVFGLFAIAKVIAAVEKTMQQLLLLKFQTRAKFNEENFQVLNLIQRQPKFKLIYFQIDKDVIEEKFRRFEGTTRSIEKFMIRSENKKRTMNLDDQKQRDGLLKLQDQQMEALDDVKREISYWKSERPGPTKFGQAKDAGQQKQ